MPVRKMTWEEEINELDIDENVRRRIMQKIIDDIEQRETKIAKLECELKYKKSVSNTPVYASEPPAEWYEKRHTRDLDKIKQMNATIDTLIEKIGVLNTIIAEK